MQELRGLHVINAQKSVREIETIGLHHIYSTELMPRLFPYLLIISDISEILPLFIDFPALIYQFLICNFCLVINWQQTNIGYVLSI